jgi:tetratricopeptide (TPR) repeat protein
MKHQPAGQLHRRGGVRCSGHGLVLVVRLPAHRRAPSSFDLRESSVYIPTVREHEPLKFSYRVPQGPEGEVVELTAAEMEQLLLKRLESATENPVQAMWELAQFYKTGDRLDRASEVFHELLGRVDDLGIKAQIIFSLGQTAEKVSDFDLAVRFYREALGMEPCSPFTWYFIHNNLGLALIGLGRYREAAEAFIAATQADASDARSLRHLEALLSEHPELEFEFCKAVAACREAVAVAREAAEKAEAAWRTAAKQKSC